MPVFLVPGCQVKIRDLKNKATDKATILEVRAPKTLLVSLCRLDLNSGDKIELEIPQRGRALCVFQAAVLENNGNRAGECHTLRLIGRPQLLQRRKSRRIAVYHRAEYILLSAKNAKQDFHEGLILNISRDGALLAAKEPLTINSELFLIFEINLDALPQEKIVPTGIGGKVVRRHDSLVGSVEKWDYSYGVAFDKPFAALNS